MGTGAKAPHLPAQGRSDPHVEQRQPSLQDRKNTNEAVGFNAEVSDVERDERQAHQGAPSLTQIVRDYVSFQGHVFGSSRARGGAALVQRPALIT